MFAAIGQGQQIPPRLKRNLSLHKGEFDKDGDEIWIIHDPTSGRFFRMKTPDVELFPFIDGASEKQIARRAYKKLGVTISPEHILELFDFLRQNNLVDADPLQLSYYDRQRQGKPGWFMRLLKGYISFRLTLFKPDAFLDKTVNSVRWLGSRWTWLVIAFIGLMGFYLVSRQFDMFLATFVQFISPTGLIAYGCAIALVKILHEFGHAYAAKAQGLKVPGMGVAFIVFWPIAFTDTTDAWRLPRKSQRLSVGAAGVGVELGIACLALFLWNVFPDGPARSLLFLLATSSWVLSLLVNLNPLMRFDGYFIFSDLIQKPNLESRAHAMAKWWLRRRFMGFDDPPPERKSHFLILFAIAIWIYRFFLFLGIALAVYVLFFKALGLFLFIVEILYFIIGPIGRELKICWRRKSEFKMSLSNLPTLGFLAILIALLVMPWRHTIQAPAVMVYPYQKVYATADGRLDAPLPPAHSKIHQGDRLVTINAPDLRHELQQAQIRLQTLSHEQKALGVDKLLGERAAVIETELFSQYQRVDNLMEKSETLSVKARSSGIIVDILDGFDQGSWVGEGQYLFAIASNTNPKVIAYITEIERDRITSGAKVKFISEANPTHDITGAVTDIENGRSMILDHPVLAAFHGGDINVKRDEKEDLSPITSMFRTHIALDAIPPMDWQRVMRGNVVIQAAPESVLGGIWRRLIVLITREADL